MPVVRQPPGLSPEALLPHEVRGDTYPQHQALRLVFKRPHLKISLLSGLHPTTVDILAL